MNQGPGTIIRSIVAFLMAVQLCGVSGIVAASGDALALASSSLPQAENAAPDFELKDLEGKPHRLSQFKGERSVLLYFWATWCPHCIASRPSIARIRENTPPSDLEILGINVGSGDSLERVKRFQKGHPVSWPMLYDADESVTRSYEVQGIPLYVLVDKRGEIVYRGHELPDPKKYLQ